MDKSLTLILFLLFTLFSLSSSITSLTGLVRDPSTSQPIPNAHVNIRGIKKQYENDTTVNSTGNYLFEDIPDDDYNVTGSSPGYLTISKIEAVVLYTTEGKNLWLPQSLQKKYGLNGYLVLLEWNDIVPDLDAHLFTSSMCHVFYNTKNCVNDTNYFINLDRDDTKQEGPETMQIYIADGTADFWVNIYTTSTSFSETGAYISIYDASNLIYTRTVPNNLDKGVRWWHAFRLNINIANVEFSFPDTQTGSAPGYPPKITPTTSPTPTPSSNPTPEPSIRSGAGSVYVMLSIFVLVIILI